MLQIIDTIAFSYLLSLLPLATRQGPVQSQTNNSQSFLNAAAGLFPHSFLTFHAQVCFGCLLSIHLTLLPCYFHHTTYAVPAFLFVLCLEIQGTVVCVLPSSVLTGCPSHCTILLGCMHFIILWCIFRSFLFCVCAPIVTQKHTHKL